MKDKVKEMGVSEETNEKRRKRKTYEKKKDIVKGIRKERCFKGDEDYKLENIKS